ncbi:MAG: threonine--tRNA ligase [Spirochaetes bacterium]|nr:threonine--tRNA ligase [Spirochaetota bacterium]
MQIGLPDSSILTVKKESTVYEIIGNIGKGLQKAAICAKVNDRIVDLSHRVSADSSLSVFTFDSREGKEVFWHSASHLMAQAVKKLFPEVKVTIGPAIDDGFYYDFDKKSPFVPEDLERIEAEMKKIQSEALEITREELSKDDAIKLFSSLNETYKVELLNELDTDKVSIYRQGDFVDMCRGPHVPDTSYIKFFKLLSIAGAYWRGDEKNKMLQRIYGVAFPDQKALKSHLAILEEAKQRDHRKLGKELELFSIQEDVGPGLVLWHPKGARLKNIIESFWKDEHYKNGYEMISTPHIGRANLWQTSGHLDFYNENMYSPMDIEGQDYYVKPMNCPFHLAIYKSKSFSYRELPLRWAELGTVYRYERSGVLHGLLRVRGFTQDDGHLICRPDQMPEEIDRVIDFCLKMLKIFGFEKFKLYLATKPAEKSVGDQNMWDSATQALEEALKRTGIGYEVDEGGGAFYGPKIDIKITDALGREWQCSTIQFDFNMSERFDLTYIAQDGKKHRPYMIHRALLGSLERFLGILIEHYAGKFPVWLAPVQIIFINVGEEQKDFTEHIIDKFTNMGIRAESDLRDETIGYKIRDAIGKKVPYIGVTGKREAENNTVSLRKRGEKDSSEIKIEDLISLIMSDMRPE